MKGITLPFEVKSPLLRKLILIFLLCWMASYSIYTSYYKAYAVEQYERYKAHIEGHSMFFNPWQYRVLCPLLIEGIYEVFDNTVYKVVEVKGGCRGGVVNRMFFDLGRHKMAEHDHSCPDDDAGHEGELLDKAQAVPPVPQVRHAIDSLLTISLVNPRLEGRGCWQQAGASREHWCDSGQIGSTQWRLG